MADYRPQIGGSIYNESVDESIDELDIVIRKLSELSCSDVESDRAIISDLKNRLLNVKGHLITLRGIGIHYKEIRTAKELPDD